MAAGAFTVYAANIDDIRFNDLLSASSFNPCCSGLAISA